MDKETTKLYELGYHIVPTVAQAELSGKVKELASLAEEHGAEVLGGVFPEIRDLAYPIEQKLESGKKEFKNAYFGWMNFQMPTDSVEAFQQKLKANNSVLRFIVITKKDDDTPEGDMFAPKKKEEKKDKVDEGKLDEAIDEMVEE